MGEKEVILRGPGVAYGTSSEETRAVGAALPQDGSCLHQEGYFCEVWLFWDEGIYPKCSSHKLLAMDVNMKNMDARASVS